MKVEIIKSKGQWYWCILAGNGKVLCHSEKYKRRRDAEHAVKLVRENAATMTIEFVV